MTLVEIFNRDKNILIKKMSINNLSKEEIIDQLQMAEYQRDVMRENLEKYNHNLNIDSDEDYSTFLYRKLVDKMRNL